MDENQIGQLVELVMQGDQNAFSTLYEVTKNSVYFICISFLNNEEDAKDVMQETYVAAYNNLYQLQDRGKFLAWINQIAVNKCKRIVMQKTPTFTDIEALDNAPVEENESFLPEEYINQKEKRKIVMDIMRNYLSDIQYETVILYYFNGLTIEEVADIMECPPGTVKYRLSVARAKIRDGVMAYEKKTEDKLYSVSGIPVLAYLLTQEACEIFVPNVFPEIVNTIVTGSAIGMSVGQTVTDSGVGSSMGYAVENMAGTGVAGTEVAKTVGKVGLGVMKKKIAIGIISLAVVGAGATAIILGSKSKDDKKDTTTETNITTEDITETAINTTEEVTEEVVEDQVEVPLAFQYQIRWMTQHNFAEGELNAQPDGKILYPNEEVTLTLGNITSDVKNMKKVAEILSETVAPWDKYNKAPVQIYNLSDTEITVEECIDNGWYYIYDGYIDDFLGYTDEQAGLGTNPDVNQHNIDTFYLNLLLEDFGTPSYVGIFGTYATVTDAIDEMVETGTGHIDSSIEAYLESAASCERMSGETLDIAWEYDDYILGVCFLDMMVADPNANKPPTCSIMGIYYYGSYEMWDYAINCDDPFQSVNVKDILYPEGFELPEKIPYPESE